VTDRQTDERDCYINICADAQ